MILVFHEGENPSTDYYIKPLLELLNFPYRIIKLNDEYPQPNGGETVIIVRYASLGLIRYLTVYKKRLKKIVYFMDDGLWDLKAIASLPPRYAWKVFKKAYVWKSFLLKLGAELWVSTDYLAQKYKNYNPRVVYPYPLRLENVSPTVGEKTIFYHGSASHKNEFLWLRDLYESLGEVLKEAILNDFWFKRFRSIKNLLPIRPMPWNTYLEFSALKYRTVGLVPLSEGEFNRGRSWVKFYDILRGGAVGVYSENAPYAFLIKEFDAGIVLPMNHQRWQDAIWELLEDETARLQLLKNALRLKEHLKQLTIDSYRKAVEDLT